MRRQYRELRPGETLVIDGPVHVTLEAKSGQRARLRVETDSRTYLLPSQSIERPAQPPAAAPPHPAIKRPQLPTG